MSRWLTMCAAVTVAAMALGGGCRSPQQAQHASTEGVAAASPSDRAGEPAFASEEDVARVRQLRVRQEVLLHAALYRAAFEGRVPGGPSAFLLEPVHEDDPPDLRVDPAEFRQQVLSELAILRAPLAWAPSTWRVHVEDVFPGTDASATRLQIRVLRRDLDQATVHGEVANRSAGVGGSRQGVIATWDGVGWNIDRDRVRVVW